MRLSERERERERSHTRTLSIPVEKLNKINEHKNPKKMKIINRKKRRIKYNIK